MGSALFASKPVMTGAWMKQLRADEEARIRTEALPRPVPPMCYAYVRKELEAAIRANVRYKKQHIRIELCGPCASLMPGQLNTLITSMRNEGIDVADDIEDDVLFVKEHPV